jgi:hypothetical protein
MPTAAYIEVTDINTIDICTVPSRCYPFTPSVLLAVLSSSLCATDKHFGLADIGHRVADQ